MIIPFVDLNAQYQSIKNEIDNAVNECITSSDFIKGKKVTVFEKAFADYVGSKYCISCGNGTDALEIILLSLGIGKGDEVIVPAISWIATAESVNNVGAEPVFVDINPFDCNIDTNKIIDKITPRTKAIMPVHLYGYPADMDGILRIAEIYKLFVIEDCAQAHGAEYSGKKTGAFGIASAFSFFPSKNLGAFGDAGAIVTDDENIARKARMITNHGQLDIKHSHHIIGRNSRLDTLQAAILDVKLKHLDTWNEKRIKAAGTYMTKLKMKDGIIVPSVADNKKHVFHLFVIRSQRRDMLSELLTRHNIPSGIHYPTALPFLEAYKYKNHTPQDFPEAFKATSEILSLPIYPEITDEQIDFICSLIK